MNRTSATTFKIYVPEIANANANAHAMVEAVASSPAVDGKETILIAEDEPSVRDLASLILTQAGYTVLAAADGAEAVELFEANSDDVSLAIVDGRHAEAHGSPSSARASSL